MLGDVVDFLGKIVTATEKLEKKFQKTWRMVENDIESSAEGAD